MIVKVIIAFIYKYLELFRNVKFHFGMGFEQSIICMRIKIGL